MQHNRLPRQEAGKPIIARTLNRMMEMIERSAGLRVAPPLAMIEGSGGPTIYFPAGFGQLLPGTTGGGYAAGSPASPTAVTTSCTIYTVEGASGWTESITVTNAYSIYTATIAASKTAWYWQSPATGNYYVVTADC